VNGAFTTPWSDGECLSGAPRERCLRRSSGVFLGVMERPTVGRPVQGEIGLNRTGQARMAALYASHAPDLARLAYFLVGDRDAAEDLVQDSFMRAFGRWEHIRDPGAFWPYLCKTVANLSRKHFRRRRVERAFLAREQHYPRPDEELPDVDTRDDLWHALRALPERQRAALVLRFYADLSEEQTSVALHCSKAAVNSLVTRGLASMRGRITAEEG
jgi:RNA polymerase sigma-70 factor (sigma-E family)